MYAKLEVCQRMQLIGRETDYQIYREKKREELELVGTGDVFSDVRGKDLDPCNCVGKT